MRKLKHFKFFFFSTLRKAEILQKKATTSLLRITVNSTAFFLRNKEGISITELAKGANKDYKNTYNDIKVLEKSGLVKLEKKEMKLACKKPLSSYNM